MGCLQKRLALCSSALFSLLCVLSHGFDSYRLSLSPSLFPWESLSCPPVFGSAVLVFPFSFWAPAVPASLCSLVSGLCYFLLSWFSLASCGPAPLPCRLSGFGLCCVWLLLSLLPTSKFFFPGKPEVRIFSPAASWSFSLGGVPSSWQAGAAGQPWGDGIVLKACLG